MPRVLARALFLTLAFAAVAVPAAQASPADDFLPVYGAADGVHATQTKAGALTLRLSAKIYRSVARRQVRLGCKTVGGHSIRYWNTHDGDESLALRLPAARTTIRVRFPRTRADVCAITVPSRGVDGPCVENSVVKDACSRVIVALNETGHRFLDERARTMDLIFVLAEGDMPVDGGLNGYEQLMLTRDDIVRLDSPDAAPPAGTVGFFYEEGGTTVVAARLRDGTRRFLRFDEGDKVFSTNVPEFVGLDNPDALRAF